MVIEELTLTMAPERVAAYLEADARTWTPFLAACDGFRGKETWLPEDRPDTIVFIIRWATREQWKRITPEQVAEVDGGMGVPAADTLVCREYVVFDD